MTLTSIQAADLSEEQREEKRRKKIKQSGDSDVSAVPGPLAFMAH